MLRSRSFVEMALGAVVTALAFIVPAVLLSFEIADSDLDGLDISGPSDRDASFVSDLSQIFQNDDGPATPAVDPQPVEVVKAVEAELPKPPAREVVAVDPAATAVVVEAVPSPDARLAARAAAQAAAAQAKAARELSAASKRPKSSSKKPRCAEPTDEIVLVGDNEYTISRDLVMEYAGDLERASRLAYVAWHKDKSGDIDGFVIKKIRCGTVLEQAGMRNGDIVRSVNGKQVKSIMTAWSAWRKVRKKDVVRVTVIRKGEKIELRYKIT